VAQQALRAHEDERLPEAPVDLAAEGVEVLRRRGQVADLYVVLGAELEEALETRARVLGALALVAVREEQHEAAHALPLRLRAGEELVDDHLRAVDEVAELRLPDDQPARVGEAHAELEAEDGVLGQHAVDDAERHLVAPGAPAPGAARAGRRRRGARRAPAGAGGGGRWGRAGRSRRGAGRGLGSGRAAPRGGAAGAPPRANGGRGYAERETCLRATRS